MEFLANTTSPYSRLVRIVLAEKGVSLGEDIVVSPWNDDPALLRANTAARVPVLTTAEGHHLTESLLIVMRLERRFPEPSLLSGDEDAIFERAGIAMGVIDASVHTLIGRIVTAGSLTDTAFDETPVGLRRRRSMLDGLARLAERPPAWHGDAPDLAVIATVVARDYVEFRFGSTAWHRDFPALDRLAAELAERSSFLESRPRL